MKGGLSWTRKGTTDRRLKDGLRRLALREFNGARTEGNVADGLF